MLPAVILRLSDNMPADVSEAISGAFVHRAVPRNVLLSWVEQVDAERFRAGIRVDPHHPFFFEHPIDHVPSILMIEAGRQLGIAVSHLFMSVPPDTAFAPTEFHVSFTRYAELDLPLTITCTATELKQRQGRLFRMRLQGNFHQHDRVIGEMSGVWMMLPIDLYAAVREQAREELELE